MTHALHALSGDLDIQQAMAQREALLAIVASHAASTPEADLALDLSAVTTCDSSGVQLLLATRNTLKLGGAQLRIVQASAVVRDVLQTFGLQSLLATPASTPASTPAPSA
ncbi:STAS domain-containing protein [Sphaerotilus mobilis]|uniref:Anti-sigma B factor antagonist n=1 Tax=Sphaerotilus mobilis TaxID=47994 RepID=A0A4Q7LV99_9BURK|nr:STAS domain-containing protein [Sphaerotilus mobilis]RZS58237.1 anti-sigma B factor antagonist [Sphaerotilus mobilis]